MPQDINIELTMEQSDKLLVQNLKEARKVLIEIYGVWDHMPYEDKVILTAIETVLRYYTPPGELEDQDDA